MFLSFPIVKNFAERKIPHTKLVWRARGRKWVGELMRGVENESGGGAASSPAGDLVCPAPATSTKAALSDRGRRMSALKQTPRVVADALPAKKPTPAASSRRPASEEAKPTGSSRPSGSEEANTAASSGRLGSEEAKPAASSGRPGSPQTRPPAPLCSDAAPRERASGRPSPPSACSDRNSGVQRDGEALVFMPQPGPLMATTVARAPPYHIFRRLQPTTSSSLGSLPRPAGGRSSRQKTATDRRLRAALPTWKSIAECSLPRGLSHGERRGLWAFCRGKAYLQIDRSLLAQIAAPCCRTCGPRNSSSGRPGRTSAAEGALGN